MNPLVFLASVASVSYHMKINEVINWNQYLMIYILGTQFWRDRGVSFDFDSIGEKSYIYKVDQRSAMELSFHK